MTTEMELLIKAAKLLEVVACPNCDGSGSKTVPLGEHQVSHEMAMGAGDPSMAGASMGIEWGQEQCQWCDERKNLMIRLIHRHENNGKDDICAKCGLDLRNEIHERIKNL